MSSLKNIPVVAEPRAPRSGEKYVTPQGFTAIKDGQKPRGMESPSSRVGKPRWITAPLAGYASADDYYTRTSPAPRLADIRVPTTIVAAADDPVIPIEPYGQLVASSAVEVFVTKYGGHLGFVGRRGPDPDRRWMDWRVVEWVLSAGAGPERQRTHVAATDVNPSIKSFR